RPRDRGQGLHSVRDPDFLTRSALRNVATIVQPLGAVLEAPLEPSGALIEAAHQHQEIMGRGVDAGREVDDGAIEVVDGCVAVQEGGEAWMGIHHSIPLHKTGTVILSSIGLYLNPKWLI